MADLRALKEKVRHLRVLFVEDEKVLREQTQKLLKKIFDDVSVAVNGKEGLELYRQTPDFELVITDILMPGLDGESMLKEITKIGKPFCVILSGSNAHTQGCEVDLFFEKPFSLADLTSLLEKLSLR